MPDPNTHTARDTWHPSAVRIQKQPRVHLPWFSWIWDRRRKAASWSSVFYGAESKVNWGRRSATCYLVRFPYVSVLTGHWWSVLYVERFCFVLNNSRPLLPLETVFFETARAGKGFPSSISVFQNCRFNISQSLLSRSSPNSTIWWLRSTTSIKMTLSIANMQRNKWKENLEDRCTGIPFRHVQMSALKVSAS